MTAIAHGPEPHHPDKAKGIANFSDGRPELVHVGQAVRRDPKLSNVFVEALCPLKRILVVKVVLVVVEELDLALQSRSDVVVVQESGQHLELLRQILVHVVNRRIHNAYPMGSYGIRNMPNANCIQVLPINRISKLLNKRLQVQIVAVLDDKDMDVAHDFKHV